MTYTARTENKKRLQEITQIIKKHNLVKNGLSPEVLRLLLEDLGPTFVKLGQIMSKRTDILPAAYCTELEKLCADSNPLPVDAITDVIEFEFGRPIEEIFQHFDTKPLGSASIAQVHAATLMDGRKVVVKVQRPHVAETMREDIAIMRKIIRPLKFAPSVGGAVDFHMLLDELWNVSQQELDFQIEAQHCRQFQENNKDIVYVACPAIEDHLTTSRVLTMEFIDGFSIDNKEKLLENGYDTGEIGTKLVENYLKQILDDGFFHADPHQGNIMIRGGKIVWIDMGMMGRLTEHDRQLIGEAIEGVAMNNIGKIQDAVLALGEFKGKPDSSKLYEDIRGLMEKYGTADMGNIDVAEVMVDLMEVMKENKIMMPHGLTMLARGLTHVEGVLAEICPDINMTQIAAARIKEQFFSNGNWKHEIKKGGKNLVWSLRRAIDIPSLAADFLQGCMKGQTKINLDLHASDDLAWLLRRLVRNIVMGLWVMALLISSSIICTTDMKPKLWGIPALGAFGYVFAFIIVLYVFLKHFFSRK